MTERQRIKNNERVKAWFQAHKNDPKWKARRKKYDKKYYLKNKEKILTRNKIYAIKHKEQIKWKNMVL